MAAVVISDGSTSILSRDRRVDDFLLLVSFAGCARFEANNNNATQHTNTKQNIHAHNKKVDNSPKKSKNVNTNKFSQSCAEQVDAI